MLDLQLEKEKIYDEAVKHLKKEKILIVYDRRCADSKAYLNKNKYFKLDIYPFWKDKAILEIELQKENDSIKFPKYLNNIKEVTDDKNYENYNLAKKYKK